MRVAAGSCHMEPVTLLWQWTQSLSPVLCHLNDTIRSAVMCVPSDTPGGSLPGSKGVRSECCAVAPRVTAHWYSKQLCLTVLAMSSVTFGITHLSSVAIVLDVQWHLTIALFRVSLPVFSPLLAVWPPLSPVFHCTTRLPLADRQGPSYVLNSDPWAGGHQRCLLPVNSRLPWFVAFFTEEISSILPEFSFPLRFALWGVSIKKSLAALGHKATVPHALLPVLVLSSHLLAVHPPRGHLTHPGEVQVQSDQPRPLNNRPLPFVCDATCATHGVRPFPGSVFRSPMPCC